MHNALTFTELQPGDSFVFREAGNMPEPTSLSRDHLTPEQIKIVEANLHLVEPVAKGILKGWRKNEEDFEEAIGDGNLGLVRAAKNYNPSHVDKNGETIRPYFIRSIGGTILKGMRSRFGRDGERIAWVKPSTISGTASSFSWKTTDNLTLGDALPARRIDKEFDETIFMIDFMRTIRDLNPLQEEILFRYGLLRETPQEIRASIDTSNKEIKDVIQKFGEIWREPKTPYFGPEIDIL